MLKEKWADLQASNFLFTPFNEGQFIENFILDERASQLFEQQKNRALNDLREKSRSKCVRDDYREVTLLAIKFFGESHEPRKANEVKFRTLINPSHAQFMATVIQGIELYLFRRSFSWNSEELQQFEQKLMRFATFASLIYIRFWNRCSHLFDAPVNDLQFLQEIEIYKEFDEQIAHTALDGLKRHLY